MIKAENAHGWPPPFGNPSVTPVAVEIELHGVTPFTKIDNTQAIAQTGGTTEPWVETRSHNHVVIWVDECRITSSQTKTRISRWIHDPTESDENIQQTVAVAAAVAEHSVERATMLTVQVRTKTTAPFPGPDASTDEGTVRDVKPTVTADGEIVPVWHQWTPDTEPAAGPQYYDYVSTAAVMTGDRQPSREQILEIVNTLLRTMREQHTDDAGSADAAQEPATLNQ